MREAFQLALQLVGREAARALLRHKLRSGLTTLGIMIGIACVVLVVAVGGAAKERAEADLQNLGDNLVWVEAGGRNKAGVRTGAHGTTSLTLEDAEAIAREVKLIKSISPQIDGNVRLIWGQKNWMTRFRGEAPEYLDIKRWTVVLGEPFDDRDVELSASKLLIGHTVREQLFGVENPVGQVVRANGQLFEIAGVLGAKGQSPDGRDQDDWVLLPYTTAHTKLRGPGPVWVDDILCSAVSRASLEPAIEQVTSLMRQRHRIGPGQEDDFNIRRPDEVLNAQVDVSNTLALLLFSVASISLLVGGIGIMNVMLASVAQRTREIGLRLAVGATAGAVQLQFLGEAVLLSVVGGVLGVALSLLGGEALARALQWPIALTGQGVLLGLTSSIAVGVVSGFYPARRASRLDPIEALRHE